MQNIQIINKSTVPAWFRNTKLFLDIASFFLALSFFGISMYANLADPAQPLALLIIDMAVILPVGLLCDYFSAKLDCSVGAHRCKHCGHVHMPAKNRYISYIGFGSSRILTCPACGKRSSHEKVFEQ